MTAIEFENVGKQYRLGLVSTQTLSHDLNRWWTVNVLHKEDPYLKIGEVNDRSVKGSSDYVWALRDINFKVEQGDVVGIIGRNGAGKSTLLKLLSRVTAPTTGHIRGKGRIGSLLEVGTGFHPEMTGRENIYMNGAILGMTKPEITRKLDEIVDFSGCERYLDTPVKRYSSGMMVRLGFAVAAHLDPEILVVDEVLAVGDAEFQKKAIGKMQEVSRGEGRTVLFVSHNMGSIRALCKSCVVLNKGTVEMIGGTESCVSHYLSTNISDLIKDCILTPQMHMHGLAFNAKMEIIEAHILNNVEEVASDESLEILLKIRKNHCKEDFCQYTTIITDESDVRIENFYSQPIPVPGNKDEFMVHMTLHHHDLYKGRYRLQFAIGVRDFSSVVANYDATVPILSFEVKYINKSSGSRFNLEEAWLRGIFRTGEFVEVEAI